MNPDANPDVSDLLARWTPADPDLHRIAEYARRLEAQVAERDATIAAWMNGVADAVEPCGFDRAAASGPADLLPGLNMLTERVAERDARIAAARYHIETAVSHGIDYPVTMNVAIKAHLDDALAALDGEAGR